jgi:hypothetical protein
MKKLTILLVAAALLGLTGGLAAADNSSHTVNVTVSAINQIVVSGTVGLTISTATAGSEPDNAVDNSATLAWTTNGSGKTIAVKCDVAFPAGVTLSVTQNAKTGGSGTPSFGTVSLTASDQTLVATADKMTYTGTLRYTATATAAAGTQTLSKTVTYTVI